MDFYYKFLEKIPLHVKKGDILVIASNWSQALRVSSEAAFQKAIYDMVYSLKNLEVEIVIVGDTPDFVSNPYGTAIRRNLISERDLRFKVLNYEISNTILQRLAGDLGFAYVQPTDLLCEGENCAFRKGGTFLYFDTGHLSEGGSTYVVDEVLAPVLLPRIAYP